MSGILYGVGVGPGDPELLTIKAVKTIEKCAVVAIPKTKEKSTLAFDIASGVCDMSAKEILELNFLMTRDKELLHKSHMDVANQIKNCLDAGQDVAMLNLGDVSVYSTFSYIMEMLEEEGYYVEMIPGITSFCAVAATLGTSLTTMHKPLHIFPAGQLEDILPLEGTKVVMKSGSAIGAVKEYLKQEASNQQIMAVSNCGLPNEVVCKTVEDISDDLSYFTTIIIKD
ncbi:MAG: precorrin-2 C(20)-methyltransferase [Lachnospiraceae bacterium]